MATIFKPTYSRAVPDDAEIVARGDKRFARFKGKDGRKVTAPIVVNKKANDDRGERCLMESACWYYKDRSGKKHKGYTDKEATRQLAARSERESAFEDGAGVVDPYKEHRKRLLTQHLEDYEQYLKDKERNSDYIQSTVQKIRDMTDACRFELIADISPSKVQGYLGDLRRSGLSISSSNHYLTAMKMFVNWMVKDRRTADNPIIGMSRQNTDTDRRRVRRPLSLDEFDRLLQATASGIEIQGISGPDRVMLYIVACYTGYRRNEIGSVTRRSFDFASSPPTLTVDAGNSKRKRLDVILLRSDFATMIQEWLTTLNKDDGETLFSVTDKRTAEMMRKDLQAARDKWIGEASTDEEAKSRAESCFLTYVDAEGRYADFHSLRKTFITNLSRAGVSPKLAQTLARHSDINLTMNTYTSLEIDDQSAAIEDLPAIPRIKQAEPKRNERQATGTDGSKAGSSDSLVPELVQTSDFGSPNVSSADNETSSECHRQETKKPLNDQRFDTSCHSEACSDNQVRETGLEPARVSPLDPKSSASANSATLACCFLLQPQTSFPCFGCQPTYTRS
jgi:integrase